MNLVQSIETAREARIGRDGVPDAALAEQLEAARAALTVLRLRHDEGELPVLRLPATTRDLAAIEDAARHIADGATDVVFVATGGASLGGQTLVQLARHPLAGGAASTPRLHFMDNLDPDSCAALLDGLPLPTTRFVVISKSGATAETVMQTVAALTAVAAAGLSDEVPRLFLGVTDAAVNGRRNGLRDLLGRRGVTLLDHDPGVGGRHGVLTAAGLLPAAIAGLDIAAVRRGAARALAPVLAGADPPEVPAALGAALGVALNLHGRKPMAVMVAYADRLQPFTRWYVQLWARSLGRDGKGTTPVAALGPVDQHRQLPLFIGGPRDKFFTIVTAAPEECGPRIDAALAAEAGEPEFGGHAVGDFVAAQGRALADTLAHHGCPVRTLALARLDEETMGELLMHFVIETLVAAQLIGVDACDQPPAGDEAETLARTLAKDYLTAAP